jgi:hypothetical protein
MTEHKGLPPTDQELAAMAEGALSAERRREIENQIASSDQIRDLIGRQRAAIELTREFDTAAPDALHMRVAEMAAERAPSRRRPRFALVGSLAAVAAMAVVALLLVVNQSSVEQPTVDQVVAAANAGPLMPAPAEDPSSPGNLALGVGDVRFPYWEDDRAWTATGARSENVGGRPVNTVFYKNDAGATIKYSIVSGAPIDSLSGADDYDITGSGDTRRIVWRNGGHTCIIEARGVGSDQLERLIV